MDGGEVDETRGGPDESDERLDGLRVLAGLAVRPPGMLRGIIVVRRRSRGGPTRGSALGQAREGRGSKSAVDQRECRSVCLASSPAASESTTQSGGTNSVAGPSTTTTTTHCSLATSCNDLYCWIDTPLHSAQPTHPITHQCSHPHTKPRPSSSAIPAHIDLIPLIPLTWAEVADHPCAHRNEGASRAAGRTLGGLLRLGVDPRRRCSQSADAGIDAVRRARPALARAQHQRRPQSARHGSDASSSPLFHSLLPLPSLDSPPVPPSTSASSPASIQS